MTSLFVARDVGLWTARRRAAELRADHAGKDVPVDYEPLRRGPTQSGVSYPTFYLWVRGSGGKTPRDRGALRVDAIEKKRFAVTDFASEETIRADPDELYRIFPAQVCKSIMGKVTP